MHETAFSPANILLPQDCGLTKWAVVACDQYTSQPEYWERVDQFVGDAPSTLRLILPESKLESEHVEEEIQKINQTMEQYLEEGRLRELEDAMIFLERKLSNGKTRLGLIGKLDLEQYSYEKGSGTPIRATEGTVLSRIPPRMKVRKNAPIELPHIMVLIDDPKKEIIEPFLRKESKKQMQMIYSTTLMEQGGPGLWVSSLQGTGRQGAEAAGRPGRPGPFRSILPRRGQACADLRHGDGNHSLATPRPAGRSSSPLCPRRSAKPTPPVTPWWSWSTSTTTPWSLSPFTGSSSGSIPSSFWRTCWRHIPAPTMGAGEGHQITYVLPGERGILTVPHPTAQLEVGTLQTFLDQYLEAHGGKIDYIHGEDVVEQLVQQPDSIGFLLPGMGKDQLFPTVIFDGALPRKTFSMGEAHDKRFYLEARKIK